VPKKVLKSDPKISKVKETIEQKVKEFIDNRLADPSLSDKAKQVYKKAKEDSDKNS
jgi:hypothetical protein